MKILLESVFVFCFILSISYSQVLIKKTSKFKLWFSYPPEKIKLYDKVNEKKTEKVIRINGAKGEYEPFILILKPSGRNTIFYPQFIPTDLTFKKNVIKKENLKWFLIDYVYIEKPSTSTVLPEMMKKFIPDYKPSFRAFGGSGEPGYYPDILIPENEWQTKLKNAFMGENTQFWFRIKIPENVKGGIYKGKIKFMARGIEEEIPLEVKVWDFRLPQNSPLKNTACFNPRVIKDYWKKEDYKKFYKNFIADYKQNIDPIYPPPKIRISGDKVEIDTKEWEEMVSYCLDELGMNHFFFPIYGYPSSRANIYPFRNYGKCKEQEWYGRKIFDDKYNLTPEFKKYFGEYLKKMINIIKKKGWFEKLYMPTMDEPHTKEDYTAMKNWCKFVKSIAPGIKTFMTSEPKKELYEYIDCWCPNNRYDEKVWKERIKAGDEFMVYSNWLLYPVDWPITNPRVIGYLLWKTGKCGYLTYAISGVNSKYLIYMNGVKIFGMGQLLYPVYFKPEFYSSIRWEMEREGFEDYEYLWLLNKLIEKAKERKIKVEKEEKLLNEVIKKIILYKKIFPTGKSWEIKEPRYANSNKIFLEVKTEIACAIEELKKKIGKEKK